jgi:hypothetical protein
MADTESFRAEVEGMLTVFRTRASGLFEPTRPNEVRVFANGTYGVLYARPSKHVRRLLSLDREVLVLSAGYKELQQRAIQLAVDIIDGTDGRLERTVAIILHRDFHGNHKLRNWGREHGLTVIPVHMATDVLPTGDVLERLLLSEFFTHDPFDVTGPVSDDNQFYGRRDEAQDLARQLQKGQVRSCLGIRKLGKTSILHRVLAVIQDYHDCFAVVVDCSKDSVWSMDAGELLAAIAKAASVSFTADDFCSEVNSSVPGSSISEASKNLVSILRTAPGTVVLLFDEVDYLTPASPTAAHWATDFNPFWRNLRAAYQELARTKTRLSVLVSGVSSKWFCEESIAGVENAALAFLPEEYLSPLPWGASVAMIQHVGRTSGLIFEDGAAAVIAETCSNMPFWIRKAGSYIHRNFPIESRPAAISEAAVRPLTSAFVQSEGASIAAVALSHLFRVYPELRPVAQACLEQDASAHPRHLINALYKYGVIVTPSAYPDITGSMMSAGLELALERPAVSSVAETDAASPVRTPTLKFESLDEWAEELALVNAQRNKLEARLRVMVLNFLRLDSLQNKQKGTLRDRLLQVFEETRRATVQHLTPDDVVQRFNWSDLINVIERNWRLFEGLFHDKALFSKHCAVINDRYDAHAKHADKADLANYRRSLAWLQDALAKVG